MTTGSRGTFIISWAQSEIDGLAGAPPEALDVGSAWRWSGQATRLDGGGGLLVLEGAAERDEMRRRAAGLLRRLLGDGAGMAAEVPDEDGDDDDGLFRSGFELTDGVEKYQATLIRPDRFDCPLILFPGKLPAPDREFWVLSASMGRYAGSPRNDPPATICFVPGTRITTPEGSKPVEELEENDLICTKDNGPQPVRWIGRRHITGGRLLAMPQLRPVRLAAHVLADGEPHRELVVSPDHRILIKGRAALALFNTPEVLVSARDLINDRTIRVDRRPRSVSYVHLMLDSHQIVWANGVEVESFHPAGAAIDQIRPDQRHALIERFPGIAENAQSYGEFARRTLTRAEAAILSHDGVGGH